MKNHKFQTPKVIIHKRANSDSYAVGVTEGSDDFHDAKVMASMEPDCSINDFATWSIIGYYMAAEIEQLREQIAELAADVRTYAKAAKEHLSRAEKAEAQLSVAISEMECAANNIAYAVYNLADMKLSDLKPGIIESTGPAESALIAERDLRAMASKLREGKA